MVTDQNKSNRQLLEELATVRQENETLHQRIEELESQQAEEEVHRLAIVNEMSRQMSLAQSEQAIFDITARFTPQIVVCQRSSIALIKPDSDQVEIIALDGLAGATPIGVSFPWRESDFEEAIREKRLSYHPDKKDPSLPDIRARLNAPLVAGGQVIGTLNLGHREPNAFTQRDQNLLGQIASLVAANVESRRLFAQTQAAKVEAEAQAEQLAERTLELSQTLKNLRATQDQLVEAEKMAALGGLVAGVAHEINTPVGVGVTAASLLENKTAAFRQIYQSSQMKRSDLEKYLDTAEQSSAMLLRNLNRAAELIQSFKQVAVDQSSEERREFPVKEYLEEILLSLRPKLKRTKHTIDIQGPDNLILDNYPGVFSQIVTNLVMNSLLHAYEPEDVGLLTFSFKQANNRLIFEYSDDGKGIAEQNLSKIFDPFFTTKRGQGGSGLGLHIIYNLVAQKLNGTIRCESEKGKGTKFIIEVPVSQKLGQ